MTLFLGFDAAKLYRPALHISEFQGQSRGRDTTRLNPLLLLLRLTLESAFKDSLQCTDGQPTALALEASEWISSDLDWTATPGIPIPPPELRQEFVFSFCWCCSMLSLDPQTIRRDGIQHLSGFSHRMGRWLPGLEGIKRHWQKAREEYEERMAQTPQPLEQRQEAMAASL